MGRYVYVRNKKTGPRDGNMWPEASKAKAVKTWLATGNLALTAATLNIPLTTIKSWRYSEWWQEMVGDLREQDNIELDKKLTNLLSKTLDAEMDRVESGDWELDRKTGQLRRVPVKLRDLHKASSDYIEKRQVLRKQPTNIVEKQEGMDGRLLKLAEQFAALAGRPKEEKVVEHVVEGEFEELPPEYKQALKEQELTEEANYALHERRETGLQEGTSLGTQEEAQSGQGQGIPEQGPSNGS